MISNYQPLYPIALGVRGRIGHIYIFKQYGLERRVCSYSYPYNPRTVIQQAHRSIFSDAVANWQGFDDSIKGHYNALQYPNVMSGYNRYIHFYLNANKSTT